MFYISSPVRVLHNESSSPFHFIPVSLLQNTDPSVVISHVYSSNHVSFRSVIMSWVDVMYPIAQVMFSNSN